MENCNPNKTPAACKALGMDPEGQPHSKKWDYAGVVGMLIYLATNTRPNISFAVSQVARFNHQPKASHSTAVKMIIRYLKGTADKGMIVKVKKKLDLDCYVDADFLGLYKRDPDTEPSSVKSRLGYMIFLAGFPLIWKSQLMQEIALSTTEAEYSAASIAMRALVPLMRIVKEAAEFVNLPSDIDKSISA